MIKQILICLLLTVFLATVSSAEAQQPKKIPTIGFLSIGSASSVTSRYEAFRQGLHELGYVRDRTSSSSRGLQRENVKNCRP